MDNKLEHGKKVKWDDWIGRFIGYLGEYEYIHGHEQVDVDYEWNGEPKADNIVYIYGAEKSGIKDCIDLLSEELNKRKGCICYGYSFTNVHDGTASLSFQKGFSKAFETGAIHFHFPCLELLRAAEDHEETDGLKEVLLNLFDVSGTLVDSVETLTDKNSLWKKAMAGKTLWDELVKSKDYLRNMMRGGEEAKAVKRLKERLRDITLRGSVVSALREEMPYDCLQMDLQINIKSIPDKRVICTINAFELCEDSIKGKGQRELLLKTLASVPGIIWVLFSSKMPDAEARSIIRKENFWRMGGISKERTIRHLKNECPDASHKWCKAVYQYTGGQLGLVNLCVEAHNNGHKYVDDQKGKAMEMLRIAASLGMPLSDEQKALLDKLQTEQGNDSARVDENKQGSRQDEERRELEMWFENVWNSRFDNDALPGETERERKDSLDFLFGTGRVDFVECEDDGSDNSVRKYTLPCLCYLIKKSLDNVGTVEQYHWQRRRQNLALSDLGVRCLSVVEDDPLFCKEYEEYPGVLYLDPIIVQVVSKHRNFAVWVQAFEKKCMQSVDLSEHKEHKKDARGYSAKTLVLVDADGNVHNVKLAEVATVDEKTDIVSADATEVKASEPLVKEEAPAVVPTATGGQPAIPVLPAEENAVEHSYREGNEEGESDTGGKSDEDRKHVVAGEIQDIEKEKLFGRDNNNPMG